MDGIPTMAIVGIPTRLGIPTNVLVQMFTIVGISTNSWNSNCSHSWNSTHWLLFQPNSQCPTGEAVADL